MFYMLANVHHQITTGEVLPPPNRFWHYLPDLPFGIQNVVSSFQMELEHLISREVLQSAILSSVAETDVLSLHTFLKILSGNDSKYDSDDIGYHALPCMCYHIDGEVLPKEAPEPTPSD
jgi:hypothetical protein